MGRYNQVLRPRFNTRGDRALRRATVGDANYTMTPYDRVVSLTANITTTRTWTLPNANSVPEGTFFYLNDETGSLVSGSKQIDLVAAAGDTLNGSTGTSMVDKYFCIVLISNGISNWSLDRRLTDIFVKLAIDKNLDVLGIATVGQLIVDPGSTVVAAFSANGASDFAATATFNGGVVLFDNSLVIKDDGDNTKILKFQLNAITTGNTRVLTVPDGSTTIVGTDVAQTLSNKTLSGATVGTNTPTDFSLATLSNVSTRGANLGSIADDDLAIITLPGSNACIVNYLCSASPSATAMSGVFLIRHSSAVAPIQFSCTDATNVVYGTATLSQGTGNGTDTALNINNPGNGKLYFKNRLGAARTWALTVQGYQ